jgi:excisionase family DNA binding protein
MESPRFIDAIRVAELLGLPDRKSVYYLIAAQGLPSYRIGDRRILFDPNEVVEWVRARAQVPAGAA